MPRPFNGPTSYRSAERMLMQKGKAGRKIGHNTYLVRWDDDTIVVRLHSTNVVTFRMDSSIELDSGGYQTVTTKRRINGCLPYGVHLYQDNWTWIVRDTRPGIDTARVFHDGMVLDGPETATA